MRPVFAQFLAHLLPLLDAVDAGGGGGDASGGSDAGAGAGAGGGAADAAPTVYDVDDNTLIKPKGAQNPVKYGEHVRGLQSQFTKASQRAAQLEKEFNAYKQQVAQQQQQAQRTQQGQPDVFAALEALPYLDGKQAAEVVRGIAEQIKQRDMVTLGMLKQFQQMQGIVNGLNQNHTVQSFEAKINNWVNEGGYPPEAVEFAKILYLAHEGDDLDQEFPTILSNYWAKFGKTVEAQKAAKVAAARKSPFIPGKGGNTGPSKPIEMKANAKSKDIAGELWDMLNPGQDT